MTQSFPEFRAAVLAAFPILSEQFEGDNDIPYMQVGAFAQFTQLAKGRSDWETYGRCLALVNQLFENPSPDLENALHVAYLEHLDFDGPRGPKAWSLLTPRVQAAWRRITAYNKKLAALPRKSTKSGP